MNTDTFSATLECSVPVFIYIENGRVHKVVIDDENLDLSKATLVDFEQGDELKQKIAIDIAAKSEWPAWVFGF